MRWFPGGLEIIMVLIGLSEKWESILKTISPIIIGRCIKKRIQIITIKIFGDPFLWL